MQDGNRYVEFETDETGGDALTDLVKAPSGPAATGDYAFGPAQAMVADGVFVDVTETETNTVEGEST